MDIHEMITVMQAFANGKKIECAMMLSDRWFLISDPSWNWEALKYRVKKAEGPKIDWDHVSPEFNYLTQDIDGFTFLSPVKPQLSPTSDHWEYRGRVVSNAKGFASLVPAEDHTILTVRPGFE